MFWTNLKRIFKSGFFNFWRSGLVSLASVLIMSITLFVIGSLVFNNALLQSALGEFKNKVDINVYFVTGAPEPDIMSLKKTLEALPEVARITYTSSDQALADFKKRHENDEFTLQALDELDTNPLGATLNIKAKEPSQYENVANFLKQSNILSKDGKPIIDKVNYYQNKAAIDRLSDIIKSSEQSNLIRTVILVLVSVIVAFNTIRLAIYISREEINVMRLVGASRQYIRGPFVITGIIYGILSSVITMTLFYPLTYWFGPLFYPFPLFFGDNVSRAQLFDYYVHNFGEIFVIVLAAGVLMGAISSYLAVRKYLKN
ncbi:ABC transporter permease [Candidatus Parcubacteria bacterium]|nr:ABC transporter permease [Candidatus Parcubacteria bacterium]